jgi:hypothetical protein
MSKESPRLSKTNEIVIEFLPSIGSGFLFNKPLFTIYTFIYKSIFYKYELGPVRPHIKYIHMNHSVFA